MTNKDLIKKADQVFKCYLLQEWGAPENITCCTCHLPFPVRMIEVGHYLRRNLYAVRWHIENVGPQCINCNRNLDGNIAEFEKTLEPETIAELRALAFDPKFRLSRDFIIEVIKKYETFC